MSQNKVSRRQLFKAAGGVVAGLAAPALIGAGGLSQPSADSRSRSTRRRQWVLVIDLRKCEGCVTTGKPPQCVEACNVEHFVPRGQEWIRVLEMKDLTGHTYFLPRPCMQCENAPCVRVCPVGASYHNEEGVVLIDHRRCIGCRLCMAACPYGARVFNWGQPENPPGALFADYRPEYPVPHLKGTVEKCMLCAHRTQNGKLPACAQACPMFAIYLGDLTEDVATNGKEVVQLSTFLAENHAFRLREELGTRPRVWYVPGHGQEYGRDVRDTRTPKKPRSWQELGATLENPHGGHQ